VSKNISENIHLSCIGRCSINAAGDISTNGLYIGILFLSYIREIKGGKFDECLVIAERSCE